MYKLNTKPGNLYILEHEMKLNANCPDSEKTGSGPGSCGGGKGKEEKTPKEPRDFDIAAKLRSGDEGKGVMGGPTKAEAAKTVRDDKPGFTPGEKGERAATKDNVNAATIFPQDLSTMSKKQEIEYQNQVIANKSFADLRKEQDLISSQKGKLFKETGGKNLSPTQEMAARNLDFHDKQLMAAVDVMTFDSKANRKIYERATGQKWEDRPASKKPKEGVAFGG